MPTKPMSPLKPFSTQTIYKPESAKERRMSLLNCWEIMECGLQPGGVNTTLRGICPVSVCIFANGLNNGIYAGRSCWAIENTLCHNSIQPDISKKQKVCKKCPVYKQITIDEGDYFLDTNEILEELSGYELY